MDMKKILRWTAVPVVAVVAWMLANLIEFVLLQGVFDWIVPFGDILAPSRWIMLGVGASLFLIYVRYKWIFRYKKKK